ncbi:MAG: AraC family transcriptional regulator [Bacteroidota bacterium]
MNLQLDIRKNILQQFAQQLQLPIEGNRLAAHTPSLQGEIGFHVYPNGLEFYHFTFQLHQTFYLTAKNPIDSEWLLLNINLSKNQIEKRVNDQTLTFQKYLPTGILFYTPQTIVSSVSPPGQHFEIVLLRLPKSFFQHYFDQEIPLLTQTDRAILYEDLDYQSEGFLNMAIAQLAQNPLQTHAQLLSFLASCVEKLRQRQRAPQYEHLHPQDLKGLFLAAAHLRNPLIDQTPSIKMLATVAGMGSSKFKATFKQVFGSPPIQYHQKIKMDYAFQQLRTDRKSPSELSYELGYSHPSKFTLAFKKQFGILPSAV